MARVKLLEHPYQLASTVLRVLLLHTPALHQGNARLAKLRIQKAIENSPVSGKMAQ